MANVGDFCNRRVVVAKPGEGLSEVAHRMLAESVGCVVVVEDAPDGSRKPIGMLTDRDIVVGLLAHTDRHIHSSRVADVMTSHIVTAWASEPLEDAFERMREFGVRRLPVINDDGRLEGLVTFDDWVEFASEQISGLALLLQQESRNEAERRSLPAAPGRVGCRSAEH
jgi:CBS domain-containing protein